MAGALASPLPAQVLLTQAEALALAFPEAETFDRRTAFLTDEDAARVEALAEGPLEQRVVTYYVALLGGTVRGVVYFDAHRVRTFREVLMVALDAEGAVVRLEVLSFAEPREYLAPDGWMELFRGRTGQGVSALRREVPNVTGATLTSDAVKSAVARSLALHAVVSPDLGGDA
jgi:hypothetical protein